MLKCIFEIFKQHYKDRPYFSGSGSGVSCLNNPYRDCQTATLELSEGLLFRVNHHNRFNRMLKKSAKEQLTVLKKKLQQVKEDHLRFKSRQKSKPSPAAVAAVDAAVVKARRLIA